MTNTNVCVVAEKFPDMRFPCRYDPQGWRCGLCLRVNLGYLPDKGEKCKCCGAEVI